MIDHHQTEVGILQAQLTEWKQGIPSETLFWDGWMEERGGQWSGDFQRRFDAETPLDPWLAAAARSLSKEEVSILDVGSGPAPVIGYKLEGVALRITAVDPLASIYANLLARHELNPPITPMFAPAEELSSFFEPNSFDIAHCRNALDHSFDPLRGISEMLKVIRVGGLILLRHHRNEAEQEDYKGFHHYNFDCCGNRFVIWNKSLKADIGDLTRGYAEISCAMNGFVDVTIRKITDLRESAGAHRARVRQYLEAFVEASAGCR
jgi:SAM-dependent methyltransferase